MVAGHCVCRRSVNEDAAVMVQVGPIAGDRVARRFFQIETGLLIATGVVG